MRAQVSSDLATFTPDADFLVAVPCLSGPSLNGRIVSGRIVSGRVRSSRLMLGSGKIGRYDLCAASSADWRDCW